MNRICVRMAAVAIVVAQLATTASAEIYYCAVAKSVGYTQTSNAPPAEPSSWIFTAALDYYVADEVLSATITFDTPPVTTVDMYRAGETAQRYYSISYDNEAELDAAYPSTTYTFTADRGFGPEIADVFLPAGLYPPDTPYFTSDTYDRLQGMDPSLDFDGSVNAFEPALGATYAATYVSVVEEGMGAVLIVGLTASDTAFQIPAGYLFPDTNYSIGVLQLDGVEYPATGIDDSTTYAEFSRGTVAYFRTMSIAPPCFGDLDGDLDVDLTDLAILLANFGVSEGAAASDGDLDTDGDVDLTDLALLLANYGTICE